MSLLLRRYAESLPQELQAVQQDMERGRARDESGKPLLCC